MDYIIEVENIKCGGCMNSIKTTLLKIEGVTAVDVDKDKETIYITATINQEPIIQKLNHLGYPQKGNNSLLKKAKSYVSCAVGNMK